jgi:hypothetical protein
MTFPLTQGRNFRAPAAPLSGTVTYCIEPLRRNARPSVDVAHPQLAPPTPRQRI